MTKISSSLILLLIFMSNQLFAGISDKDSGEWTFVSIPDFLNVDVRYPEPKWDDALNFILSSIKNEDPDFVLVAGDMVMGRWWRGQEQIKYMADIYYQGWIQRMEAHDLDYYVSVGDHELGDNPWIPQGRSPRKRMGSWDVSPLEDFNFFEAMFIQHFQMPKNGPSGMEGLTYSFLHKDTLIISLDVFEKQYQGKMDSVAKLSPNQLSWLDKILSDNAEIKHKIVMGHSPILGPVRKQNSSGIMYHEGRDSSLWKLLDKHNIDMYLSGEVHAITATERDGIQQIAHGSLIGYNTKANYLVGTVNSNGIKLELKEIDLVNSGRKLEQSAANEPFEYVSITDNAKVEGFKDVGTMEIRKRGSEKYFLNKKGYFDESNNPKK